MNTTLQGVNISPVNVDDRKNIGIKAGDTVRVHQKIVDEKGKARMQAFDGVVLARKHGTEPGATFTVRKVIDGMGVEKVFPLYSPLIDQIEILKRAKVRRAKLYYIREKVAREIRRQMRRMHLVDIATESEAVAAARAEEAKAAELNAEGVAQEGGSPNTSEEVFGGKAAAETSEETPEAKEETTEPEIPTEDSDKADEEKKE